MSDLEKRVNGIYRKFEKRLVQEATKPDSCGEMPCHFERNQREDYWKKYRRGK